MVLIALLEEDTVKEMEILAIQARCYIRREKSLDNLVGVYFKGRRRYKGVFLYQ